MHRQETIGVVIPTRNGETRLRATLEAVLASVDASSLTARVVVVDNGSTDRTSEVVAAVASRDDRVALLRLGRSGSAAAKNAGVQSLGAEAVLFTDDDVVVPLTWVERMSRPLRSGDADAVAGAIRLAPGVPTHGMTTFHHELLADTQGGLGNPPRTLIGASMGVAGGVFDAGFAFDEHLGPGALGYMEESLLHLQVVEAGGATQFLEDVVAIHHVDASRLAPSVWLMRARLQGRCEAWITHHWEHRTRSARDAYIWARGAFRLALDSHTRGARALPSERQLQRVRRVGAGEWWLRHGKEHRVYPTARWVPARLDAKLKPNRAEGADRG